MLPVFCSQICLSVLLIGRTESGLTGEPITSVLVLGQLLMAPLFAWFLEWRSAGILPVDQWIDLQVADLPSGTRKLTNGRGADVVFDVVGGAMFEQCLSALAWRGRQVAISSSPEPRVSFHLGDFYHNESRLLGVDSLKLSFEETSEILRGLTPGIEAGRFTPPQVKAFSLEEGLQLYRDIAESKIKTKSILTP